MKEEEERSIGAVDQMSANVDSQKRMMDKEEDLKRMEAASKCAAQQIRDMLSSEDVATLTHLQLLMYVCEVIVDLIGQRSVRYLPSVRFWMLLLLMSMLYLIIRRNYPVPLEAQRNHF